MRAREFITEETHSNLDSYQEKALSGTKVFPNMDQYYELYRFGLAMAGSPDYEDHDFKASGPLRNHPATFSYSKADEEIIQTALKKMGKEGQQITAAGSREPEDTNVKSPVASAKKNRYGV